jgi:histidinol-phosphate aminotransferase
MSSAVVGRVREAPDEGGVVCEEPEESGAIAVLHPLARYVLRRLGRPAVYAGYRRGFTERKGVASDVDEHASFPPIEQTHLARAWLMQLEGRYGELGVDERAVLFTRGSTEAMELLLRAFCDPGRDWITITTPTARDWERPAALGEIGVARVPLFGAEYAGVDVERLLAEPSKLLFLSNPNDAVGSILGAGVVEAIASRFDGIVVADETYAELAMPPFQTALALVRAHRNVVVVRTLSRGWGLAGLRVGVVVAHPSVINALRFIADPFALPSLTRAVAYERLLDHASFARRIALIKERRAVLRYRLETLRAVVRVIPSHAGFLTACVEPFDRVLCELERGECLVTRLDPSVRHAVRITVGSPLDNERVVRVLERHGERADRFDFGG